MEWTVVLWKLGEGLLVSLGIFAITLLFSLPLGLLVAFGRMHKNPLISGIIKIYISFMRGTPLMLQLFMVYYGPYYIFKVSLHPGYRMTAVYIGFILNYAAYFAEIYRSGIQSMDRGQYEAAEILGYSKMQCFFRIILPQVWKKILPSITNEVISLVKDTSLAFSISVMEMFTQAKALSSSQSSMFPLIMAGVLYYIFNFVVAFIMEQMEKKMAYYQ
ncbi:MULTISPECIES: amino acid ABC transporter permease [Oribacterium]|jgi:amino ABC transporter, permease protein, 3-TM region, his/glu/gln/arg/opine family|uniref:ABC transporter, permease protein n=2 Tax=Oribacterium sinus TaxID=237576 RepID=C2KXY9_9FIRM|nr:amino acid ABC transporter permease [Oribacterium sinus]EEJ51359.1 ABC transporter, permease protein [Oribacterium sinus F0268]MBF1272446.1 amino acid ABC transporter permease [Oribacterium sinus]MBF1305017.1 amino acid ABC transporter permease [Oribacterium sinus]